MKHRGIQIHEYDAGAAGLTHYWSDDYTGIAGAASSADDARARIDAAIVASGRYEEFEIIRLHMGGYEARNEHGRRIEGDINTVLARIDHITVPA